MKLNKIIFNKKHLQNKFANITRTLLFIKSIIGYKIILYLWRDLIKTILNFTCLIIKNKNYFNIKTFKTLLILHTCRDPENIATMYSSFLPINITFKCNLSCRHCFTENLINQYGTNMKFKDFEKVIWWVKNNNFKGIKLLGGEPTVHPNFLDMVQLCYKNNLMFYFSTNNLYPDTFISKFNHPLFQAVLINYDSHLYLSTSAQNKFKHNLDLLKKKNIPFVFNHIIDVEKNIPLELIEDSKNYKPSLIQSYLLIPGYKREIEFSDIIKNSKLITNKIKWLQEKSLEIGVPFCIVRPLPDCIMLKENKRKISNIYPNTYYTRCPLGIKGNYGNRVIVNPDLSTFPCSSIFITGPNILDFKNITEISNYFEKVIKSLISKPVNQKCEECKKFNNFIQTINREKGSSSSLLGNQKLCQGGCFNFRNLGSTNFLP